jgi:uncharacterized protein (TIGR02001 family)
MLMQRTRFTCILCMAMHGFLLSAPAGAADQTADPSSDLWGGSVAITTDYIYRGISQTNERPAAQAGVQIHSPSGWNAGAWGSSVDFGNGAGTAYELDLHAGYAWSLNPNWSAQVGMVHYAYLHDGDTGYDYDEVIASVSFQQRVTASVAWSWNTSRRSISRPAAWERQALAYELSLLQPLHPRWSLSGGVGYYDLQDLFDAGYWFWSTGLTFSWQGMQVDLLHIDTTSTATRLFGPQVTGGRWTAALSWRF